MSAMDKANFSKMRIVNLFVFTICMIGCRAGSEYSYDDPILGEFGKTFGKLVTEKVDVHTPLFLGESYSFNSIGETYGFEDFRVLASKGKSGKKS